MDCRCGAIHFAGHWILMMIVTRCAMPCATQATHSNPRKKCTELGWAINIPGVL